MTEHESRAATVDQADGDGARRVVEACELLITAVGAERAEAAELAVRSMSAFLRSLGYGVHPAEGPLPDVRGDEPAYRVESTVDYVVRDRRRAANLARATAARPGTGLCTEEPLEDDPMGLLLDLLNLEVPASRLHGAVDVFPRGWQARPLTKQERRRDG